MSLDLKSYKGTRDLYPADMRVRNYIFKGWRKVVESFGYEEYQAPVLEPLAMYAAKSGEEIVNEQTFRFTDRGGRELSIRPEMTPSVSRMVAAKRQEMPYPARLYSIANFMRYERPQHGREREFWQLNFDMFGVETVDADTEILLMSHEILREFGATNEMFTLKINDRRLTDFIFREYFALPETKAFALIKLMDRYDKMPREAFESAAQQIDQNFDFAKFDAIINAKTLADLPEEIRENPVAESLKIVLEILGEKGVKNAKYDPTLMRGFDYYTGIVFEVFDEAPENRRAMFGGGRYDGLVGLFGVEDLPVVGAAPGETMFAEFLKAHDLVPKFASSVDVVLMTIGDIKFADYAKIADFLRGKNVNVAIDFTQRKFAKKIKAAEKIGAKFAIVLGEDEIKNGCFELKNIAKNESTSNLAIEEIAERIAKA